MEQMPDGGFEDVQCAKCGAALPMHLPTIGHHHFIECGRDAPNLEAEYPTEEME